MFFEETRYAVERRRGCLAVPSHDSAAAISVNTLLVKSVVCVFQQDHGCARVEFCEVPAFVRIGDGVGGSYQYQRGDVVAP